MRQKILMLIIGMLAVLTISAQDYYEVSINEENFPDVNFRNYLINHEYGFGQDGILTVNEIHALDELNIEKMDIYSLKGIEHLKGVIILNCSENHISNLDLSENSAISGINCSKNDLESIDISKCYGLSVLVCETNKLSDLDLTHCPNLKNLNCKDNQIKELNLSKNGNLTELYCSNNALTKIDLSSNTKLIRLDCNDNNLTNLNLSSCSALTTLQCDNNKLTSLIMRNCTSLTGLYCRYNDLTELDLSQSTSLKTLDCHDNMISSLKIPVSDKLRRIDIYNNCINKEVMGEMVDNLQQCAGTTNNDGLTVIDLGSEKEKNVMTKTQVIQAKAKGWRVIALGGSSLEYEGSDDGSVIELHDGDSFTAKTKEDIEMTFIITSEANKTCKVCNPESKRTMPVSAIDNSTKGTITIPSEANGYKVTVIGEEAFYKCADLTSIIIPNDVTAFEEFAFANCSNLTEINFPSSLTYLGYSVFSDCPQLSSITLPNSVTSIGEWAFADCKNLMNVYNYCEKVPSTESNAFNGTPIEQAILHVLTKAMNDFQQAEPWKYFGTIKAIDEEPQEKFKDGDIFTAKTTEGIEMTFRVISAREMTCQVGNGKVDNGELLAIDSKTTGCVTVPAEVEGLKVIAIAKGAFNNCYGVTELNLPEGIIFIGEAGISRCINLKSLILPESLKSIGQQGLEMNDLREIHIPKNLADIKDGNIFSGNNNLVKITVADENPVFTSPENSNIIIRKSDNSLFLACQTSVIPQDITTIGAHAFGCCRTMSDMKFLIPSSVTSIGRMAFYNCAGLKEIMIPENVTNIDRYAFDGCKNLQSITIQQPNPFVISDDVFDKTIYPTAKLIVPVGSKVSYQVTDGWKNFQIIEEIGTFLDPIESETTVSTEGLGNEDLSDNVVNDVYYNVGDEAYDTSDGSIVIGETTNMSQIADATPGSDDVKEKFTGLILKVAKGKGTIKVNVKTTGNAQLVVQVGNGTPMIASKTEQGDVVFSYDVAEDTYVYVYAIIGSSAARAMRVSSTDMVKIYGITVSPGNAVADGDANGDGDVNVADVDYVIERIGEALDATNKTADVNDDGEINVADVDYIIERIV